jgi:NADH dehydrogenase [ubiquinone] 1 alpha subcomplex assembly factor 1
MPGLACFTLIVCSLLGTFPSESRDLFTFDAESRSPKWQIVNDGVMGGRSQSQYRVTDDGWLEFKGTLSLENNGGFASVRLMGQSMNLTPGDTLVARVRGDGRTYTLNIYDRSDFRGYSFRQTFSTKKDEWIEVEFPIDEFVATWRGRTFRNEKLQAAKANGLGFLLGDKKPGPFQLEIDWVRVRSQSDN